MSFALTAKFARETVHFISDGINFHADTSLSFDYSISHFPFDFNRFPLPFLEKGRGVKVTDAARSVHFLPTSAENEPKERRLRREVSPFKKQRAAF